MTTITLKNNPISKASSIVVADFKQTLWQWGVWLSAACVALFVMIGVKYVHEQQVANLDQSELRCLTDLGFNEARDQGEAGILATMVIFYNRAQMGHRGATTLCEAIYDPKQASFANSFSEGSNPSLEGLLRTVALSDNEADAKAWATAEKMAIAVLLNQRKARQMFDLLDDADHYLTEAAYKKASDTHWSKHADMRFIAQIGDHKFFRWEG